MIQSVRLSIAGDVSYDQCPETGVWTDFSQYQFSLSTSTAMPDVSGQVSGQSERFRVCVKC